MTVSTERIVAAAREVLETAALEDAEVNLSAAEILERLPDGLKAALRREYKAPRGAGQYFTAEMRVAQVVARMPGVEHEHAREGEGGVDSVRCSAYGVPGTRVIESSYRVDSKPPSRGRREQTINTGGDTSDACTPKPASTRPKPPPGKPEGG